VGARARQSQDRCGVSERAMGATVTATEEDEGEWGQPRPGLPFYRGGPLDLSIAVPSTVQNTATALSREIREKIKAEFLPMGCSYDLNLSLGHQLKRQHQDVLMANHFASPHISLI
jgi:hypothetical protein